MRAKVASPAETAAAAAAAAAALHRDPRMDQVLQGVMDNPELLEKLMSDPRMRRMTEEILDQALA